MSYNIIELLRIIAKHGVAEVRDEERHLAFCETLRSIADVQIYYIETPESVTLPDRDSHLFTVSSRKEGIFPASIGHWALLIVEKLYGQHIALYGKCSWDLSSSTDT